MECHIQFYNAGTGMEPWERLALIKFLSSNCKNVALPSIREAIDCALKNSPSFGGFILIDWEERQPLGAVVVNRTGMSGFGPENLLTFAEAHHEAPNPLQILEHLTRKAIEYAEGEIAFHLPPRHPALKLFQDLGFRKQFVELRFSPRNFKAEA